MSNNILNSVVSQEYYLNPDFDLSLSGRPSLLESSDNTFIHEMAWHFLFAVSESGCDSLIVHRALPEDFLEYLNGNGLQPPRTVVHPGFTPDSEFTPFGWNLFTESLAARYVSPTPHPDLAVIKQANSRAFSLSLEREWWESNAKIEQHPLSSFEGSTLCATVEELEKYLGLHTHSLGWVVKGNHGHAGIANRRIPIGPLGNEDRRRLSLLLADHGSIVVEPWHERLMDMAVNFYVNINGDIGFFRGHQLINSRDGAFLGVKIFPTRLPPDPWRDALKSSAEGLGKTLATLGYFGQVSVDAYVWNSPQGPRLRPLVDINARLSMALPAHGLAARLPGKFLLWMWAKPRKMNLPSSYKGLKEQLGNSAFHPSTKNGILAASPLSLNASHVPEDKPRFFRDLPKRIGFLFSADSEEELLNLQADFSKALGRA